MKLGGGVSAASVTAGRWRWPTRYLGCTTTSASRIHACAPPARLSRRSPRPRGRRRTNDRSYRPWLRVAGRLHALGRRVAGGVDGRQNHRSPPLSRRRGQDEPRPRGRRWRATGRIAVHAVWRRGKGPAPQLHRRGATRNGDSTLREIYRPAPRAGRDRGDGPVRRDDGRRARERRTRHALAGAMSAGVPNEVVTRVPVVLASQSPRRRELLALIGIEHEVRPANIDE